MSASNFPILRGLDPLVSRLQDNIAALLGPLAQRLMVTPIMGAAPPPWTLAQLINGFSFAPGAGNLAPAWQLDALGYVHLRGRATHAAGTGALTIAFRLPLEMRPGGSHLFAVAGSGALQTVIVAADGFVYAVAAMAAGAQVSFEFVFQAGG